jgi:hypothetical protein
MLDVLEQPTQLAVIANKIDSGLQAFEQRKSELIELEQEADGLKIESLEDKETINQVSVIRKKLKSARVEITKEGKSMRDPLTTISRIISDKEKELIAIIEPTEKSLQEQEKWVEDEKEKIRLAEIAKEEARIQERINALAQYGFEIDYSDIKSMSDETFEKYVEAAKVQYEAAEAEKAEAERLRLEQEEKEKAEREAERLRIEAERKELDELRKKQAEAQRIIDEQNAKIEAENKRIADEKAALERAKQKEIEDKKRAAELKEAEEKAAEAARLKAIQDLKDKETKRLEDERKAKLAAERKAARQPDKIKIEAYISSIKSIQVPELKTDEGKAVMASIQELISRFDNYATEKVNEL